MVYSFVHTPPPSHTATPPELLMIPRPARRDGIAAVWIIVGDVLDMWEILNFRVAMMLEMVERKFVIWTKRLRENCMLERMLLDFDKIQ